MTSCVPTREGRPAAHLSDLHCANHIDALLKTGQQRQFSGRFKGRERVRPSAVRAHHISSIDGGTDLPRYGFGPDFFWPSRLRYKYGENAVIAHWGPVCLLSARAHIRLQTLHFVRTHDFQTCAPPGRAIGHCNGVRNSQRLVEIDQTKCNTCLPRPEPVYPTCRVQPQLHDKGDKPRAAYV